jgi:small-conductance mechanosensitive channel
MRTKDFAFVGAKVVGIILFINGIKMLLYLIAIGVIYPSPTGIKIFSLAANFSIFFSTIFFLVMSLLFLVFTEKIIKFFVPKEYNNHEGKGDEGKLELHDLQTAAFTVVGVVILSIGIPKIFYAASEILVDKVSFFPIFTDSGINPLSIQLIAKILGHLIYLLIGIYLVFGFKKFLSIIVKMFSSLKRDIDLDPGDKNGKESSDDHEKPES